jgi:hypothetical protein
MDTNEVQQLLDDLEPRIERLKSLYQQYFMGIEKIPPHVLRKDVERSLWRLRRQRLQTTRLRFKFQQIVQRYNTYQQHWARIMRDIERGTFKRDVVRAARRFGEEDALAEVGRVARAALERELHEGEAAPPTWEIEEEAAPPAWEIDEEEFGAVVPVARPGSDFAPPPRTWELSDEDVLPGLSPAPVPDVMPARVAPPRSPAAPSLPAVSAPAAPAPSRSAPAHPPGGLAGLPDRRPPRPPPPPPARGTAAPRDAGGAPPPPPPRRRSPPPPATTGASAANPPPETAPKIAAAPPARPVPPHPQAAARPTDRTRQIYDDYLRARRAAGEKVDNLSYDALRRSLERQTERLRRQHGNRQVDYEVVTKDGRALIRPVIK